MKKLFAILTATMLVCGLCVAPAFATEHAPLPDHPYYPTEVTDIDGFDPPYDKLVLGHEDFMEAVGILVPDPGYPDDYYGGVCGGNTNREMPKPNPDEKYVMLLDGTITTTKTDVVVDPDLVPTEVVDIQWEATDDGTPGAVMAIAIDEKTAKQAAEDEFNKNHSTDGAVVTDSDSGYYPPERTEVLVKEAWDEEVCTPATKTWGYKVEGDARGNFSVDDGAFVLIKQASDYVVIWSEDADFSDYPTAEEIAKLAKDGSIKDQQVFKWRGIGEFYPTNLGNPWKYNYVFSKDNDGIHFQVDKQGISHADVYVPGKPGECKIIHHDAEYETIYYPGAGWANIVYIIPNDEPTPVPPTPVPPAPVDPDPEDPVIPDEPSVEPSDNPDNPILDPVVEPVVPDNGNQQSAEVTIANTAQPVGQKYLPQTGDHLGDLDSIIAISITVCLAAIFMALCRKFEEE